MDAQSAERLHALALNRYQFFFCNFPLVSEGKIVFVAALLWLSYNRKDHDSIF